MDREGVLMTWDFYIGWMGLCVLLVIYHCEIKQLQRRIDKLEQPQPRSGETERP